MLRVSRNKQPPNSRLGTPGLDVTRNVTQFRDPSCVLVMCCDIPTPYVITLLILSQSVVIFRNGGADKIISALTGSVLRQLDRKKAAGRYLHH